MAGHSTEHQTTSFTSRFSPGLGGARRYLRSPLTGGRSWMQGAHQTTPRHGGGGAPTICPRGRDGQRTTAATTNNSGSSAWSRGETQVAPLSLCVPYVRAAGWRVGTSQTTSRAGASQGQAGCPQSARIHAPDVTTSDGAPSARGHRDEPKQRGPAATATRTSCQLGPRPPLGSRGLRGRSNGHPCSSRAILTRRTRDLRHRGSRTTVA